MAALLDSIVEICKRRQRWMRMRQIRHDACGVVSREERLMQLTKFFIDDKNILLVCEA